MNDEQQSRWLIHYLAKRTKSPYRENLAYRVAARTSNTPDSSTTHMSFRCVL